MPTQPRRVVQYTLVALLLLLPWLAPARPAAALQGSDPMAIISAVNALRAASGLPPYVVDQGLMNYALEHSRYQASLHTATHTHSDGTTVWQHGMDENIATGMLGYLTPEFAVYTIWSDAIHMKTMIGYANGYVGAGVADDGADEYYTLDVRPTGKQIPTARPADPNATPTRPIPIVPLLTVTPRADRWIIHTVGYGQSLWSVAIAYGVKMDMIRAWNSMAAESNDIYAGQKIYIIAPPSIWPTYTPSPTGGPGIAATGQTVTPGRAITEEPAAATQKAAYQTAEAQTQSPGLTEPVFQGTPVAELIATATPSPAEAALMPTGAPAGAVAPPAAAEKADSLPLVAGISILLGGILLVLYTFSVLGRRRG